MDPPILTVSGLKTQFKTRDGLIRAVDGVDFRVHRGETVGIVGESGSGKSITALSILQLVPPPGRIVEGSITFDGRDVLAMKPEELRKFRGNDVAMVFQDPMSSLNPVLTVGFQVGEAMIAHDRFTTDEARARVPLLLQRLRIPDARQRMRDFPYQFSGGMRQRAVIAMALSNEPKLVIADEPTTALDVTVQAQILQQLRDLNRELGTAILLITHNIGVIASICSWVVVLYAGRVVEQGPTEAIFRAPQHPYTWSLFRAFPRIDQRRESRLHAIEGAPPHLGNLPTGCKFHPRCPFRIDKCITEEPSLAAVGTGHVSRCWVQMANASEAAASGDRFAGTPGTAQSKPSRNGVAARRGLDAVSGADASTLLALHDVSKQFPVTDGLVRAVDHVSLEVRRGETVGLVGESGSGKSTLARLITQLVPVTGGRIVFDGQDLTALHGERLRQVRRRVQMVFQDPYSSLNPRMTIGTLIGEPLGNFRIAKGSERETRVRDIMRASGLHPSYNNRYPHEFSGGERQRIAIARSLVVQPSLVIADEPISALDVSMQAQIINLLEELQEDLSLTYLFIAHDLSVVRHISDRVAVMYLGVIVEVADSSELYENPLHPYTTALLQAIPVPDPAVERDRKPILLQGEIPSLIDPPQACRFHTRCPIAEDVCSVERPPLIDYGGGHLAACHFPGKLQGSLARQVAERSVADVRSALVTDSLADSVDPLRADG
jgi:peptide/nickel transport system ATP-binding protein